MFTTCKKVYDEVMNTPQETKDDRVCDVCSKPGPGQEMFLLPGDRKLNYDVCEACRSERQLEEVLEAVEANEGQPDRWHCDLCNARLGGGCKWFASKKLDIDVCSNCYGRSDELLVTRRVSPDIRLTKRGLRLKFVDPSTIDYYNSSYVVTPEWCEGWANEWSDLVRVPKDFVWMEWTRVADWHKMKFYPAWTSLAVRCVFSQPMQVAALVKDSDGRIAVQVVFDTFGEFLDERDQFQARVNEQLPQAIELAEKAVQESLEATESLSSHTLMICATEYSEFICLEKEIPLLLNWCD